MYIKNQFNQLVNLNNFDIVKVIGEERVDGSIFAVRACRDDIKVLIAEFENLSNANGLITVIGNCLSINNNYYDVCNYYKQIAGGK